MERSAKILEQIMQPAFLVKDGTVICANNAAIQKQIPVNTDVAQMICIGAEDYAAYTTGKLSLSLCIEDCAYVATVNKVDDCHIFILDSDYDAPELQAYALAAQQLREPLTNVMASTQQLLYTDAKALDDDAKERVSQISHGLYQILRLVGNMTDSSRLSRETSYRMQKQDIVWVVDEILQKACTLTEQAGRQLCCRVPNISVTASIDREQLERAILNLISNALKYSPNDSSVDVDISYRNNRLHITVENDVRTDNAQVNLFNSFLRPPGLENNGSNLGLGMLIVRKIAAMHSGTVLAEHCQDNRFRVTMAISTKNDNQGFRSPVLLPVDYAGGFDHSALELSDVLPASVFGDKL